MSADPKKALEDLKETCELLYWQDQYDQAPELPLTEEEIEDLMRRFFREVDGEGVS